ncbi:collagen alpha-1(XII) chain-like [Ruditapes philippinarum]|uniref:collagen alpha-1(XII) chain-like n=1 Tax=Ruditapes philippinarum TaxID=129788 RepID=UPI00295AD6FF|nr:collagen alpha-1(XII) chain-like [Ruditapes philippinarum]
MNGLLYILIAVGSLFCNVAVAIDKSCPFNPVDIVFVLDGSGSEGAANFNKQLMFVENITEQFEIGEDHTRVSLVTFGTGSHNEFYLNQYYNKTQLLSQIAKAHYPNGETNTHYAINFVRTNTLTAMHGAERNVTKLVIVLTDGRSLEPSALQYSVKELKKNPLVTTIAVGIGGSVDPQELLMIAKDANHTFQVSSFDALNTIQGEVTDTACNACNNIFSDVCFVLDSSGSEGAINFHKQLEFVNIVVNEFSFEDGAQTRVCLVTFANNAHTELHLRNSINKETIMSNVLKVPWSNGETMTNKGLDNARNELHRSIGSKVVIVLTDGRSTEPDLTQRSSEHLHRTGIETFVVGIGNNVDRNELRVIASDRDHVFNVGTFDQLPQIHQDIVDKICATAKRITTSTSTTTTTTTLPPTTTKAACGLKPADIVFVLDSSDSEGADNFKTEVDFVYDFAAQFSIGANNVQFSVVTFSSDIRNDFFFNKHHHRHTVLQAIRNIQYMGQGTNTSGALNFVRTQSLLPLHGARTNSSKFVIVITDGRSDNQNQTKLEANLLHKQAQVISVGIGPAVDRAELANIASNHHVVTVNSFALLKTIKRQLTDLACESG